MTISIKLPLLLKWVHENTDWDTAARVKTLMLASAWRDGGALSDQGIRKILQRNGGRPWSISRRNFGAFCNVMGVQHKDYDDVEVAWSGAPPRASGPDRRIYPVPRAGLTMHIRAPQQINPKADPRFRAGVLTIGHGENRLSAVDGTPHTLRSVFVEEIEIKYRNRREDKSIIFHEAAFDTPRNYVRLSYAGETFANQTDRGGVTIVIIQDTAEVVLAYEVRPNVRSACAEAPRGFPSPGDKSNSDTTAQREANEEVDARAMRLSADDEHPRYAYWSLGSYYTDTGALSDRVKLAVMISKTLDPAGVMKKLRRNRWQLATITVPGKDFFAACAQPGKVLHPSRQFSAHEGLLDFSGGFQVEDNFTLLAGNLARSMLAGVLDAPGCEAIAHLREELGLT